MKTYTEDQVRKKIKTFVKKHPTASAAADAVGCTGAQVSLALRNGHIAGKLLNAVGLARKTVYADE